MKKKTLTPFFFSFFFFFSISKKQLVKQRVQLLESLIVIEKGFRAMKKVGRRTRSSMKMSVDERYSKMKYNIVPHNATQSSSDGSNISLSSDDHVSLVHRLLKESMKKTIDSIYSIDSIATNETNATSSSSSSSSSSDMPSSAASTNLDTSLTLEPTTVYRVTCEGDEARYEPFDLLPSQQQMWYGIRKCELNGVLSKGISFPSAEAPISAFPYGKCVVLSTSPLEAAKRCFEFEALSNPILNEEEEDVDEDDKDGRIVVLGLCTVACGNMHTIQQPTIFVRPPIPCHSVRMHESVMIYDSGQIKLDSIVFFNAVGGLRKDKNGNTSEELVDQIMEEMNVVVEVDEDVVMEDAMDQTMLEQNLSLVEITQDKNEHEEGTEGTESSQRPVGIVLAKKSSSTSSLTSKTAMDFANEILMEAEGTRASP